MHVPIIFAVVGIIIVGTFNFLMWKHYMDIYK